MPDFVCLLSVETLAEKYQKSGNTVASVLYQAILDKPHLTNLHSWQISPQNTNCDRRLAFERVDFTIVANVAEWMRASPRRKGVGGEAAMNQPWW